MGEGHNATGRALHEAALRLWPDIDVQWVDVLDAMGCGSGPLFRRIYATSVERLPRLYDFFYGSVWRYRWFARASKRVIGAWSGRRLAPVIDRVRPDIVVSTYPMGTTGLEWLRRRRGMTIPAGAWVSDFAPHPSWVHTGVDLNMVMHEVAVEPARDGVPGARVGVSAPPVSAVFHPGDRAQARARLGVPDTAGLLALVSCGSLGFGRAARTVREILDGDADARVIVVAGRNEPQRLELERDFHGEDRVDVRGWVDDMPELMRAADVVVTNAGGATSLEALACGRAVLMHNPIAGHGLANARLMEQAGLALVCDRPGDLASVVRRFRTDPDALAALEREATRHTTTYRLADGLRRLAATASRPGPRSLSPEDALFLHVDTPTTPQHVGTVLVFEPDPPLTVANVEAVFDIVPGLSGTLRRATLTRGARWEPCRPRDRVTQVDEVHADDLGAEVDRFFSTPLDGERTAGVARVVTGLPDGRQAILMKLHHALGDGMTVLQALLSDTDDAAGLSWAARPALPLAPSGLRAGPRRLSRGLWWLARAGRAPRSSLDGPVPSAERHHQFARLPGRVVRRAARTLDVTPTELLLTIFAEALNDVLGPREGDRFRLMVPWSLRGTDSLRVAGNHTGALSIDLPLGPMAFGDRARLVAGAVRQRTASGVPEAAHAVVRTLGWLPPGLRVPAARWVYRRDWFNAIGTVMPGPRREVRWHGTLLSAAYPVLALAPGTGLAWGALTWGPWITVCFTGTPATTEVLEGLAKRMDAVLSELIR